MTRVNKQHLSHIKVFDGGRCQRALQNPLVLSQTECFVQICHQFMDQTDQLGFTWPVLVEAVL